MLLSDIYIRYAQFIIEELGEAREIQTNNIPVESDSRIWVNMKTRQIIMKYSLGEMFFNDGIYGYLEQMLLLVEGEIHLILYNYAVENLKIRFPYEIDCLYSYIIPQEYTLVEV